MAQANPCTYAWLLPKLTKTARRCGYALALHGSMARDLDLIAVPWVKHPKTPTQLTESILGALNGWIDPSRKHLTPLLRPHGRQSVLICFTSSPIYIDLSIMTPWQKN